MVDTSLLISNQVVLWHPKNKSNPKTRESRLWVFGGVVVFDPDKLVKQLETARSLIKDVVANKILVICEKMFYKNRVEELSVKHGFHFLNHKVPSWVLTNFDTLLSRIKSLKDLRNFVGGPAFSTLTKKEQSMKKRELKKIEKVYKWVSELRKKPDLVVIIDGQMMHKFVLEVEKLWSPAIVVASSDFDKIMENSCVVTANTNSITSLDVLMEAMFV